MENLAVGTGLDQFQEPSSRRFSRKWLYALLLVIVGIICIGWFVIFPPASTPKEVTVVIPSGMTSRQTGELLQSHGVVRYGGLYTSLTSVLRNYGLVHSGEYKFTKPYTLFHVVRMTLRGEYGGARIKITFPEGVTVRDMGAILTKQIPNFKQDDFLGLAQPLEGKLFPDTYFFFESTAPQQIISRMQTGYLEKIKPLFENADGVLYTEDDVIVMASILEREAKNSDEAGIISGILWKRLEKGMPLQVDATFLYTIGKGSDQLTTADLAHNEPYNTYVNKGLPPGPIGNPGVSMVEAALHPVDSSYYYYLHDPNGHVHFAKTYSEHLANKKKYLK